MTREDVVSRLTGIFHDVFDDDRLAIEDQTSAKDIALWDSLTHITLIAEIEDEFGFKFSMKEVVGLKNVGEMIDIILREG